MLLAIIFLLLDQTLKKFISSRKRKDIFEPNFSQK